MDDFFGDLLSMLFACNCKIKSIAHASYTKSDKAAEILIQIFVIEEMTSVPKVFLLNHKYVIFLFSYIAVFS